MKRLATQMIGRLQPSGVGDELPAPHVIGPLDVIPDLDVVAGDGVAAQDVGADRRDVISNDSISSSMPQAMFSGRAS